MSTFEILLKYREGFLSGLLTTIELATVVWVSGLVCGTILGYLVDKYARWIKPPFSITSFILSGVPVIVFLVWAHYPLQSILHIVIDPFFTACWVLSVVNIFAVAQIIASALAAFPSGYIVAAQVCGISPRKIFLHVKLPIVLRQIVPSLLSSQVVILQATLFASLISVEEIFRVSQRINATAYKPIEIYSALAIIFLVICLPLNGFAVWFRARFTKNVTEDY